MMNCKLSVAFSNDEHFLVPAMTLSNHPEHGLLKSEPLDVPIPPNFARIVGYPGEAQYVAFWWEPYGDEIYFSDGRMSGTGASYAFLAWMRHPKVEPYLRSFDIGSSEESGTYALLLGTNDSQMQVVLRSDVIPFLRIQHPPPPQLSEEQIRTIQSGIERLLSEYGQTPISTEEIAKRMRSQQEAVNKMIEFLNNIRK